MRGATPLKARRREVPEEGRTHILVVEDEQDLQDLLRYNLTREGFTVTCAESAERGLKMLRSQPPALVLLDLMLPGMDGLELCRMVRQDDSLKHVPIVMLTAKGEEADVVTGLELGADDYIPKPFSPRVLLARVRAVLRRGRAEAARAAQAAAEAQAQGEDEQERAITVRGVHIDPERHEVRIGRQCIDLTVTEFRMLQLLASRPGRVYTRQSIINAIHGAYAAVTDRSVDVQIVTLRRKLGESGGLIETVRGVGYRFKD